MQQEYVYLLISNYENRSKVQSVGNFERIKEIFVQMDSFKPDNIIREIIDNNNIKYYSINNDGAKQFKEQLYIERRPFAN